MSEVSRINYISIDYRIEICKCCQVNDYVNLGCVESVPIRDDHLSEALIVLSSIVGRGGAIICIYAFQLRSLNIYLNFWKEIE